MRRRTWLLSVPVTICILLQPNPQWNANVSLGRDGNGKGKGPQCHQELFCNPQQCEQLVCQGNPPCPSHPQCECAPIPSCTPTTP